MADVFDPDNPTFYGESYGIWGAYNVTGTAVYDGGDSMTLLYDDDAQPLNAGDSIIIGAHTSTYLLKAGDEAIISWVIETDATSSGTLNFRGGKDPDWEPNPDLATESLGTVTVTGRQTIVLEQSTFTVADLFNDPLPAPVLLIAATSGSVSIRQVRLRVWPPGGARGQMATVPGYARTTMPTRTALVNQGNDQTNEGITFGTDPMGYEGSWYSLAAQVRSAIALEACWLEMPNADAYNELHSHGGSGGWLGVGAMFPIRLTWHPSGGATESYPHPDMVSGEPLRWGQSLDGGEVLSRFVGWSDLTILPPSARYGVTAPNKFDPDGRGEGWYRSRYDAPDTWRESGTPLPPIPDLILTVAPVEVFTGPPAPFDGLSSAIAWSDLLLLRALESVPDHLVWDPTAAPDDRPAPRFFWKDDLDQWRAIGPGKPADDLVLFKIKTAMGIYSEPRPGDEPGVGAHPLRVKVDTGYGEDVWDTPVWMEPQD